MKTKTGKLNATESATEGGKVRSTLSEPTSRESWSKWFRNVIAADPGGWLFVSVNISKTNAKLASESASRDLLLGSFSNSTNPVVWISEWESAWNKFFTKLKKFELRGHSSRIKWFAVYENEGRGLDPKSCPTHSHLCVKVPDDESTDAFVRRFCSAFNTYVFPLKVTAGSEWVWDVERHGSGAVLVIVKKRDAEIANYVTKQIKKWDMSNRISVGGLKDVKNKTNERK